MCQILVHRLRCGVPFFPDQTGEAYADHVAGSFLGDIENLGVNADHVGFLGHAAAFGNVHPDFREHLRRL
jgi:hypothetical protein